jgi:branched-chain amino acid transport system permease protein
MMAALAGAVQAHYVTIITPNNLMILQMSLVVAMAVIAGVENFIAAAIGAILIEFMLEMLRTSFSIGGVEVDMSLWRLVFFGVLLMLTLRFARNGLLAQKRSKNGRPTPLMTPRTLHHRRGVIHD